MSNNTNTTATASKIKVDHALVSQLRANKAQANALVLALQDFIDAPGKDTEKAKRKASAARIGKDVLKRKNALAAKTPGELRKYVEVMKQRTQAIQNDVPKGKWLLEHCTSELVRVLCAQIVELCDVFVAEYNEGKEQLAVAVEAKKAA